jgi:hypothetical protein
VKRMLLLDDSEAVKAIKDPSSQRKTTRHDCTQAMRYPKGERSCYATWMRKIEYSQYYTNHNEHVGEICFVLRHVSPYLVSRCNAVL